MYTGEFYAAHWDWGSHIVNLHKPKPHQRFVTFLMCCTPSTASRFTS